MMHGYNHEEMLCSTKCFGLKLSLLFQKFISFFTLLHIRIGYRPNQQSNHIGSTLLQLYCLYRDFHTSHYLILHTRIIPLEFQRKITAVKNIVLGHIVHFLRYLYKREDDSETNLKETQLSLGGKEKIIFILRWKDREMCDQKIQN